MNFLRGWGGVALIALLVLGLVGACIGAVFFGLNALFQSIEFHFEETRQGTWQEQYVLEPENAQVVVDTTNGSITVLTWDNEHIEVTANYRYRSEDFVFAPLVEQTGNLLKISHPQQSNEPRGVSYTINIPAAMSMDLGTSNGTITVTGPGQGNLELVSSNGSLKVSDWQGDMAAIAGNGSIELMLGILDVGNLYLETGNGQITLSVDAESRFESEVRIGNGRFNYDLPGTWEIRSQGGTTNAKYNEGGAQVSANTGNGSVVIRER